ncbi:hypothetical protein HDU99_006990, partial [Rhizoclosmatium hyalinum]
SLRKRARSRNAQTKLKLDRKVKHAVQATTLLAVEMSGGDGMVQLTPTPSPPTMPIHPFTEILDLNECLNWINSQAVSIASAELSHQQSDPDKPLPLDKITKANMIDEPHVQRPDFTRSLLLQWLGSPVEEMPLFPPGRPLP